MNATGPREQANNACLRRLVADLSLDKEMLTEVDLLPGTSLGLM